MGRDTSDHAIARDFTVLKQVIAWVVAVLIAYGALQARVSVLEERVNRLSSDIQEIKQDVKTLLLRK